ncbi:MAG: hypothetical protein NT051_04190 [Candidatus Micrarchaeota archaeon]|nr:hypothetical protein [Candidatus Micrarchaeota archaeon]
MKGLVLVSCLTVVLMLLLGCAGQQASAPQPVPQAPTPNVSSPAPEPVKNITKATEPPPFNPIHLSYLMANTDQQGRLQNMNFDYYFAEKTACGGRPALNGFMAATQPGQQGTGYAKVTVYLDTGEAAYSEMMGETDLAFDTAKPKMADFDFAFYLQTITARGGKTFLSGDVWNATSPVLLKGVNAFGGVGDYSITSTGSDKVAGLACKKFTASIKSSNMDGQILMCVHQLDDMPLSFVASAGFPAGENGPAWHLTALKREKSPVAYYSQCLAPVSCPALSKPTQEERDACNAKGNSLESKRDDKGCITAFVCLTQEEKARGSITNSQRSGCAVNEQFIQQTANCWKQNGNVNYDNDQQSGCITKVNCNAPSATSR